MSIIGRTLVVAMLVLPVACAADQAPPSEDALKKSVVAMVEQGWSRGEVEVFSELIADTVDFHYAGEHRVVSLDQMNGMVLRWREAFPDLRMEIGEMIAEGDFVAATMTLSGTHEGEWGGVEPTGQHISMALMMMFRFEDGKLVELWESDDQLGFQRQLGLVP